MFLFRFLLLSPRYERKTRLFGATFAKLIESFFSLINFNRQRQKQDSAVSTPVFISRDVLLSLAVIVRSKLFAFEQTPLTSNFPKYVTLPDIVDGLFRATVTAKKISNWLNSVNMKTFYFLFKAVASQLKSKSLGTGSDGLGALYRSLLLRRKGRQVLPAILSPTAAGNSIDAGDDRNMNALCSLLDDIAIANEEMQEVVSELRRILPPQFVIALETRLICSDKAIIGNKQFPSSNKDIKRKLF
jgi:hypothetical protein